MTSFRIDRLGLLELVELAQDPRTFQDSIAAAARALPADPSAILDFFEIPSGDAFDVSPDQAIAFFKAKGLQPTFSYADMLGEAHDHAFTVAKMMDVDMLGQIRASLDSALANGTPFRDWADSITPILQSGGWWGRQAVIDPLTGQEVVAQLGSPWRLQTIFRTNMQSAYAAGAWQEIQAQADIAPFLMYDAVDDFRTRPAHAAWDRTILPLSDDWWRSHYPPNGYNCRCGVIQLSQDDLEALGLQPNAAPPQDGSYTWTNPRTGQPLVVPNGIDPGFDRNVGQSWATKSQQLLQEKIAALPADMQAAAIKAVSATPDASSAAAQQELAAEASKAAIEAAAARAAEKAKQWAAKEQIELIAKGEKTAIGKGAQYKVKALQALKKTDDWPELTPTDQLAAIEKAAKDLDAKAKQTHHLFHYKKSILAGKTPTAKQVDAFQSLTPDEQAAFLTKLDAEKAAIEAKKAAEAAAQAKATTAAQPSPSVLAADPAPPNPATMIVIGRKTKGGTSGAFYQDTATGQKYLVKFNGSEDAVLNEVLAARLYNRAGVEAPEVHYITIDGQPALASRIIDGIVEVDAATLARTPSVQEGFAVDAWLANWDSVGLNYDNTVLVGGRAVRIDVGGSLRYRAIGGLKGNAFGRTVGEIDSLRDGTNPQARAVFGTITREQIERGVEKVLAIPDADIRALVEIHGPRDATDRARLIEILLARKADLARRYPEAAARVQGAQQAAAAPPPPRPRVTPQEQQFIDDSRVNGYGIATDKDDIEDHMVVVSRYTARDGTASTRAFLKLRPEAGGRLAASGADAGQTIDLIAARELILKSAKSINHRASNATELDASKRSAIINNVGLLRATIAELRAAASKAASPKPLNDAADELDFWTTKIQRAIDDTPPGATPQSIGNFDQDIIPPSVSWATPTDAAPPAVAWRKISGSYSFNTATFDRSFARETAGTQVVYGVDLRYEADLPDGSKALFFPHHNDVPFALRGVLRIDVPRDGVNATERAFEILGQAGIDNERANELARKHLYLNAFARLQLSNGGRGRKSRGSERAEFAAFPSDEAGLRAKLDYLRAKTGVDIEASDGWTTLDGVRQAFGHGRAYQLRPDLTAADLQELGKTHSLYHNPFGIPLDGGSGVFEKLKPVFEGGGVLASLVDRMRRGVPFSGTSVSSDLSTGGGDFTFTRIRQRDEQFGTGVYFRASQLRRMDAITYDHDAFGKTEGTYVEENRKGQNIASFKDVAAISSSNETIFKGGLSLFDDLHRIVLQNKTEVDDAIAWLKDRGYSSWPDGRKLQDVIVTRDKHRRNP